MILGLIAVSLDVEDSGVMKQPVEDGCGDDGVAEQILPIDEAVVRSQDRGALFVTVGYELEEQMRLPAVHRQIPNLVDDDEACREEGFFFALGLLKLRDHVSIGA